MIFLLRLKFVINRTQLYSSFSSAYDEINKIFVAIYTIYRIKHIQKSATLGSIGNQLLLEPIVSFELASLPLLPM